ncbi:unnamed protein product [Spodoptera littoralis]|uniref:C2H2-type domain-containing protein n=1 Tax=Spodoptera littoralis TaxID=7109 RepID=A0A9P0I5W1_SPOLI|nr:unnamed protein product [Spodoptera littoralis]CAH1642021.1 unnamed protein product [Spodoptera littoralis]
MANDYYFGNKTENYNEMLMNVFNIDIIPNNCQRNLICEECVTKLRDAAAFKRKVLGIQEAMRSSIGWERVAMELGTKYQDADSVDDSDLELSDTVEDSYFHCGNFNRAEKEQTFVISINQVAFDSKTSQKPVFPSKENENGCIQNSDASLSKTKDLKSTNTFKSKLRKTVINSNVTVSKQNLQVPIESHGSKNDISDAMTNDEDNSNDFCAAIIGSGDDDVDGGDFEHIKVAGYKMVKRKCVAAKHKQAIKEKEGQQQTDPHLKDKAQNTLKLIQNSNLCVFKSFRNKFGCMLCPLKYPVFSDLREHYNTHRNTKRLSAIVRKLRGINCKNAEVTNLKCNKCSANCNDLTDLIEHLKNKHDISLRGKEHYLVPYKLQDGGPYQCLLCDEKLQSYMKLSIHMNSHFPNNVCEICGQSFMNRRSLSMHVQCQHKEKKCSKCPAVFLTNGSRIKHLRQAHGIRNSKRYCNLCSKHFTYTYMVDEHKIKEHGFKRPICNCPECGKTFSKPLNLKTHIRSVHIKERNYPCPKCELRFFTNCDLKRHEKTHEELRSFCCTYCVSKFKSKDSWRRHLRRQHGHVFGGVTLSKSDCTIE